MMMQIKVVLLWIYATFLIYLFYDAVVLTPLVQTGWGWSNEKLDTFLDIVIGTIAIIALFNTLKKKEDKND